MALAYTVESTTDYSDLFAMNVTVLHKDDSAMMIRVNEGGTVVEGVVGDISGLRNDHFNTIVVDGAKYTWTTPPRIGTTSGALLVVTTSTTSGASGASPALVPDTPSLTSTPSAPSTRTAAATSTSSLSILTSF